MKAWSCGEGKFGEDKADKKEEKATFLPTFIVIEFTALAKEVLLSSFVEYQREMTGAVQLLFGVEKRRGL